MIQAVGEDALLISFGDAIDSALPGQIAALCQRIEALELPWLVDLVPSYTTLLVIYDPVAVNVFEARARLRPLIDSQPETIGPATNAQQGRLIELPVYYSQETGPDLAWMAEHTGLSSQQIIERHTAETYQVYAIGFAPGFGFMGQVDPSIACPRKDTPRTQVPAGSVGIANRQTAVYPKASPGGWQLIGRCPTQLFDEVNLSLLRVGDKVRFVAIGKDEFLAQGGQL
ncbi:sensor histidine kinase inhibitor, KipI family [Marinobacter persicus]|uniref:Sensor histidine kinase inhibitor, KipI family n=1 Tax=Marinobacter persicus TaxID=930118 RepID=A0A1I3W404_9GAMM|nr:5-oxoprolinase subunit PxpB [Marinobacter persicus]GHD46739.1 allophanate hydrolase [Marinobacter persicus]SFK02205.1 sensor histidine kinase inhibitor, KipI family [Marinobacter persicus]